MMVARNTKETRERAEASFKKKALQVRVSSQAMADYEAAGVAVRTKTERLKSLRLAKEVNDLVTQTTAEPAKKTRTSVKTSSG
ncbi:MAG: hypothetical protein HXX10_23260 [Rhodoplanes sp.]|uniref:hypothetical protein n=1 Tax=Rhodoplanes sp. TaxID=1968906 RepID=UPI0017AFBD96|nr:hypothetical protein [Rhodoplanes sp.]NVO16956.1 hypothetical protein [Rhodoplanes sp.]